MQTPGVGVQVWQVVVRQKAWAAGEASSTLVSATPTSWTTGRRNGCVGPGGRVLPEVGLARMSRPYGRNEGPRFGDRLSSQ